MSEHISKNIFRINRKMTANKQIRIGGASGYWGDSNIATTQLIENGKIDYLVYDYLAEVTMSIMARAKENDPLKGYATDFVTRAMAQNLDTIAKRGIKVLSNAGGVNPQACAVALQEIINQNNLNLKVAYITGDDLLPKKEQLATEKYCDMFDQMNFPVGDLVKSVNAYLGAIPISKALEMGADIVITGRCVDSAVTLAACLYEFNWQYDDYDKLASASLAGHIIECGAQATGGNFTDWQQTIETADNIGYPIATVYPDGLFNISKPDNTGGQVSIGTIVEQMLYEIGDPQAYLLPDVTCDFSQVTLHRISADVIEVRNTKGRAPGDSYKVCTTWFDGYRAGTHLTFVGPDSHLKGKSYANAVLKRVSRTLQRLNLPQFSEISLETIGFESQYGDRKLLHSSRETSTKIAVKNDNPKAIGILLKEIAGMGLSAPAGLISFAGARAQPSPVYRLFSFLYPKHKCTVEIHMDNKKITADLPHHNLTSPTVPSAPPLPQKVDLTNCVEVPLFKLAWGRSGDKGNHANIGIAARKAEYYPYLVQQIDSKIIQQAFSHFFKDPTITCVTKFLLPGTHALNFMLFNALGGGGVSSLRHDPQGKAYAQIILDFPVLIDPNLLDS